MLPAISDEPLWTNAERLERRDIVIKALVETNAVISTRNDHINLYHAVLKVESVEKGKEISTDSRINIYYECSSHGFNFRCPDYANLTTGEAATFYLRNMTKELIAHLELDDVTEPAFFLEMGSDVRK